MYEIRKGDMVVALTEKPNYIYCHEDGYFVLCEAEMAQGIAVGGTAYHLYGKAPMEGCETVLLVQKDTGNIIKEAETVNNITFVKMAEAGDIDDVTAGEHAELFGEWAYPVTYKEGQMRVDPADGCLYRVNAGQGHTSQQGWNPSLTPALWTKVADPAEEWPAWSQPICREDSYGHGAKTSHKDKHWTSDYEYNTWEPGVHGWTEAVAE